MTLPDTHDTDNTAFLERAGEQIKKMWGTTELFRLFGDVSPYRLFALLILILLSSLTEGLGIVNAAKLASLMGSLKIAVKGPQTYQHSREEIVSRFEAAFGHKPW